MQLCYLGPVLFGPFSIYYGILGVKLHRETSRTGPFKSFIISDVSIYYMWFHILLFDMFYGPCIVSEGKYNLFTKIVCGTPLSATTFQWRNTPSFS